MVNKKKLHLKNLSIQNLGIIKQQIIKFHPHFNAIIGETGSGKSLILDAIELIIGFRGDKKLIRKDSDFLLVEGVFPCQDAEIKGFFEAAGFPFDEEITVKRIIYKSGQSKTYVNHQLSTLQFLKTFARKYVDLVGQFENQKLLSSDYQLGLLDLFAENQDSISEYKELFHHIKELKDELYKLKNLEKESLQRQEFIEFQLQQLEELNPTAEGESKLLTRKEELKTKLENKEKLEQLRTHFEGGYNQSGISSQLSTIHKLLVETDHQAISDFQTAQEILNDISYNVSTLLEQEFPEEEYENIVEQLNQYQKLKRKFDVDSAGLEIIFQELSDEIIQIRNLESTIAKTENNLETLIDRAMVKAEKLHDKRSKAALTLSEDLTKMVRELKMDDAQIRVNVDKTDELGFNGVSEVQFQAETNSGEGFYSIRDIASGGELSRILLAVRNILAAKDSISIFLFDEIDTGIGGETALCVGNAIENVAKNSQVITITHLPQIARFADKILKVEKEKHTEENRTIANILEFEGELKSKEVGTMIPMS